MPRFIVLHAADTDGVFHVDPASIVAIGDLTKRKKRTVFLRGSHSLDVSESADDILSAIPPGTSRGGDMRDLQDRLPDGD